MSTGNGANRPSKKDRRQEAREKARLMREEAKRKAKRRRWIVQGSVAVGVLAVLAIIAVVIVTSVKPAGPGPKNMASGGILLTSSTSAVSSPALGADATPKPTKQDDSDGKAHITLYIDYQCPYCNQFETTNTPQISTWLDAGAATLEIHPVAILNSPKNDKYATRAGNAMVCVANYEPSAYLAASTAMYKNQPDESGTGLPDSKIVSILKSAGATDPAIAKCVTSGRFSSWVDTQTSRATAAKTLPNSSVKFQGTPTVIVNGKQYNGSYTDATAFSAFVKQVVPDFGSASAGTATPTPTATK